MGEAGNVRLYERGEVHATRSQVATECGALRFYAVQWLPTEQPVTCKRCVLRMAERKAVAA